MPQSALAHRCQATPGRSNKPNTAARRPAAQHTSGPARRGLAASQQQWRRPSGSGSSSSAAQRLVARAQPAADFADFVLVPWDASRETWDEEAEARVQALIDRFKSADKDGNGVIDRAELRDLLERVGNGEDEVPMHWLSDDDLDEVIRQYDTNADGVISFEEFVRMAQDKIFMTGKLQEYRDAFRAVDSGGNGTISATELFQRLDQPVSYDKLVKIMDQYDLDQSGVIDFPEFLRMFRNELLDLKDIMTYIKARVAARAAALDSKAAASTAVTASEIAAAAPVAVASAAVAEAPAEAAAAAVDGAAAAPAPARGKVNLFFSEDEFNQVLAASPGKVVVVMATVTWCKPCKRFQPSFEQAAQHYTDAVFLKFYANSNDSTKHLFKERLKARTTPTFFFFRGGQIAGSCTGAREARLEATLREAYGPEGPPQPVLWPDAVDKE